MAFDDALLGYYRHLSITLELRQMIEIKGRKPFLEHCDRVSDDQFGKQEQTKPGINLRKEDSLRTKPIQD